MRACHVELSAPVCRRPRRRLADRRPPTPRASRPSARKNCRARRTRRRRRPAGSVRDDDQRRHQPGRVRGGVQLGAAPAPQAAPGGPCSAQLRPGAAGAGGGDRRVRRQHQRVSHRGRLVPDGGVRRAGDAQQQPVLARLGSDRSRRAVPRSGRCVRQRRRPAGAQRVHRHQEEARGGDRHPGRFDAGCKLPIGITVTRNRLGSLVLNDSGGLRPRPSDRDAAVRRDDGCARVRRRGWPSRSARALRRSGGRAVPAPARVRRAARCRSTASWAWSRRRARFRSPSVRKRVSHCAHGDKHDPLCALQSEVPTADAFFDGGVFDNVPLGLGVSLAMPRKPRACPSDHDDGDIEFLYVDPGGAGGVPFSGDGRGADRRRTDARAGVGGDVLRQLRSCVAPIRAADRRPVCVRSVVQRGPAPRLDDGGGADGEGRQSSRSVARLRLSSRFFPVVGNYLGAFGAFFARSFREYDFYVGIYDAFFGVAEGFCRNAAPGDPINQGRCITAKVLELEKDMGLAAPGSEPARYVVDQLLRAEISAWLTNANATPSVLASIPAIDMRAPAPVRRQRRSDQGDGGAGGGQRRDRAARGRRQRQR